MISSGEKLQHDGQIFHLPLPGGQGKSIRSGAPPCPKMHTWLIGRCHAKFSQRVPFQVGGDRLGARDEVDYSIAAEQVDMLDWRRMGLA